MSVKSLSSSSLTNNVFYRSLLAGSDPFIPFTAADDLLEEITLTTSASSVTFSGLGAYTDYKHLQIRMITALTVNGGLASYRMRFNSDSGGNYSQHALNATYFPANSGVTSNGQTAQTGILGNSWGTDYSNHFWPAIWDIQDFSSTNKNTTVNVFGGSYGQDNSGSTPEGMIRLKSGAWYNTAAVTSISLVTSSDAFAIGSRFSLIGIR